MYWETYFIKMAHLVSEKSKDPSTKTGVVIASEDHCVLATGFNGFPRGVDDADSRYADRKTKYALVAHAETNAIYSAARHGIRLEGATIYTSFGACICQECAKAIVQVGIAQLIGETVDKEFADGRWRESLKNGALILKEGGVFIREIIL